MTHDEGYYIKVNCEQILAKMVKRDYEIQNNPGMDKMGERVRLEEEIKYILKNIKKNSFTVIPPITRESVEVEISF